jgi:DNA polymerase I-like protein with 3'-5' exonuclease and polymerase domains
VLRMPDNVVAFDTETTGLWPWPTEHRKLLGLGPDRPFAFSFANLEGETAFFRAEVDPTTRKVDYSSVRKQIDWLKKIAADPNMTVVMHNAAFDMMMTRRIGIVWKCKVHDTKILAHTADPSEPGMGLKELGRRYLDIDADDQAALKSDLQRARRQAKKKGWRVATADSHGKNPAMADYWLCDPDLLERYARIDAYRTIGLFLMYTDILEANKKAGGRLWDIYEHELELLGTVVEMEENGITYRHEASLSLRERYVGLLQNYLAETKKMTWPEFSPSSPKHMQKVFLEQRGYEPETYTDKGNPQINGTQLSKWAKEHNDKLCQTILEWKASKKAVDELDRYEFFYAKEPSGRCVIHPRWKATGPITGRLACSDPNLMQITNEFSGRKRATLDTRQREVFGPEKGRLWYQIDYSQIEVWIFAFVSNDDTMKEALLKGVDFHGAVAEKVFSKRRSDYEQNKALYRRRSKLIMFSKLYGGGIKRIASLINCTFAEAKEFVSDFEAELPNVERYMKRLTNRTVREGKIVNVFGREYPIERGREYKCVNYTIQGSAAEVMKRALVRVSKLLRAWPGTWLSATIHDEVIIDIPEHYHSKVLLRKVLACLQADHVAFGIPVPLPVKVKVVREHLLNGKEVKVA